MVSYIQGNHSLKFWYEGWPGDGTVIFQGPYGQLTFQYNNLINSNPYSESGLSCNPLTGAPQSGYSATIAGAFVQDTWKVNGRVTVNYGLRYDNYGNPYPTLAVTIAAPFFLGSGSTLQQKIASGYGKQQPSSLSRTINWTFAPRGR